MDKPTVLITLTLLMMTGYVAAQKAPEKVDGRSDKQETVAPGNNTQTGIKVVPSARNKHAKPEKVSSARTRAARPDGQRPARNIRPSNRPLRPGSGRN